MGHILTHSFFVYWINFTMKNTTTSLSEVRKVLLSSHDLDENKISSLLSRLKKSNIDDADLYFQHIEHESWLLEDGVVKEANAHKDQGVGVRAISGAKTGFAYSDEITFDSLVKSIDAASSIVESGQEGKVKIEKSSKNAITSLYTFDNPLISTSENEKVNLLKRIYDEILRLDKRIVHVTVSLSGTYEMILVAREDGLIAEDIRPLVRLHTKVVVLDKNRRESGISGDGGRFTYDCFLKDDCLSMKCAHEAVRIALVNLEAAPAPAGNMPVVLGPGFPGVLLHEAVGHGLEGDFNRKGCSAFSGKIGERVATSACTVVDQGDLPGGHRGSLNIDDEGTKTGCTVLIENGILRGYMQDRLNARLMGMKPTGNGRRESYAHIPMPRMTNTYMLAGESSHDEIISSVKKGLYAVNFSGGQVDITSGKFVFTTVEAYLIENGKITSPVKDAAIVGNGPDVLKQVSMVGNNLIIDPGIGTCGKDGQSVPVNVGQPTLKVDSLTVGGTSLE